VTDESEESRFAQRRPPAVVPSEVELRHSGRRLAEVLALAEKLAVQHGSELRFPRVPTGSRES